ncbi:hypothetical protein EDB86DRAFT_45201 [Lactarius hatsudake]|nr:hypothetical protein EDB86DRAFT_45201 [Lactarius hatsudake]
MAWRVWFSQLLLFKSVRPPKCPYRPFKTAHSLLYLDEGGSCDFLPKEKDAISFSGPQLFLVGVTGMNGKALVGANHTGFASTCCLHNRSRKPKVHAVGTNKSLYVPKSTDNDVENYRLRGLIIGPAA